MAKHEALLNFLNSSPTAWHAVEEMEKLLDKAGFEKLEEGSHWKLKPGKGYYVTKRGTTLCAFVTPTHMPTGARVTGSHTDSPGFKLKPNAEFTKENMALLGLEIYGGPLITSWLNRDLGIAGKVVYKDAKGHVKEALVRLDKHPVVIPQLAIHLDREVNEKGLLINKQEQIAALAALDMPKDKEGKTDYLETVLKEKISLKKLLSYDLFLFPLDPARLIGLKNQMISAYRIDNLSSAYATLAGLVGAKKPHHSQIKAAVFWDHEEVGSHSSQGAGSPFFPQLFERICLSLGASREDYLRAQSQSFCLSVDFGHALHPNYSDKHEPRHPCLMNRGVILKTNSQQRYSSDASSAAEFIALCEKNKIPFQKYVSRNDIPCGSTIGPIHAALTGMRTLDIGCAQLSMHSARELASCKDVEEMEALIEAFYSAFS